MVTAEAGGKDRGGEEGEEEEGVWGREWTAMEDTLLVYWCCPLLAGGRSEPCRTGITALFPADLLCTSAV